MMEYVNSVLDRVDGVDVSALRLLVTEAFKVNSQGFLSAGRVLAGGFFSLLNSPCRLTFCKLIFSKLDYFPIFEPFFWEFSQRFKK